MPGLDRLFVTLWCVLALFVSAVAATGCGGDDSASGPAGVSSVIDGNARCDERSDEWPEGDEANGSVALDFDELTFSMDPAAKPERIASGPRKGLYSWDTPVELTSKRSVILELDREQIKDARLLYEPLDADVAFDDVASTVRFQSCNNSDLFGTGKKLPKLTGWEGAILTKEPATCLRGYVFSERNSKSQRIEIPLGEAC